MFEFDFSVLIYLLGLAVVWGTMITEINSLKKSSEKHNNVIERVYIAEASGNAAHKRLDEIRDEVVRANETAMEAKEMAERAMLILKERGVT